MLVGGLLAALIAVLVQAVEQALALLSSLPEMLAGLPEALERVQARVSDFCAACPEGLRRWAEGALADLPQLASSLAGQASSTALRGLSSLMAALPGLFLACGTTVLAVFFTLTAYPQVMAFLRRQLPARWRGRAGGVKASVLDTLGKWLRAECILLLVTFLQLLAGLLLLRQEYALLLALLIALIDALPVFGTGTVLLPWAAVLCVAGDVPRGIALAALYAVIAVVRSVLEPKVMAAQGGGGGRARGAARGGGGPRSARGGAAGWPVRHGPPGGGARRWWRWRPCMWDSASWAWRGWCCCRWRCWW